MPKTCDHTSVGVLVYLGKELLMIERKNYPQAYALPAGHCDGDTVGIASDRELNEEVGIRPVMLSRLLRQVIENPCKRTDGDYHDWEVYLAEIWEGAAKAGSDAKKFFWASPEKLKQLAERTEYFMKKYDVPYTDVGALTFAIFGNPQSSEQNRTDEEWYLEMGLEPVWYYILKKVGVI